MISSKGQVFVFLLFSVILIVFVFVLLEPTYRTQIQNGVSFAKTTPPKTPPNPPDNKLFHLVTTRILVGQGEYTELSLGRFDLFRTFFFPSFVNQKETPYPVHLLLVMGTQVHPIIEEMFRDLISEHPYSYIVKTDKGLGALDPETTPPELKERLETPFDHYVNTRMDMDDSFGHDMMFQLQNLTLHRAKEREKDYFIVTFPKLFLWHSKPPHGHVTPSKFKSAAAGMTLVLPHPYDPFHHFSSGNHMKAKKLISSKIREKLPGLGPCQHCWVEYKDKPMWLYVRSHTSDSRRASKLPKNHYSSNKSAEILEQFGLDVDQIARSVSIQRTIAPRVSAEPSTGFGRGKHRGKKKKKKN